jgi:hypothetical protein
MSLAFRSSLPSVAAPAGGAGGATSNIKAVVTSDTQVTFSAVNSYEPAEVSLFDQRGKRVLKALESSLVWNYDSSDPDDGLLDASGGSSKGFEKFWIWGPGKDLKVVGLLNGATFAWSDMPAGYTYRSKIASFVATDATDDLLVSRTIDGWFSYDPSVDLLELDVVTSKTTATSADVNCAAVVPASRKWMLVEHYFQNTSGTKRDSYIKLGTRIWDRQPAAANATGGSQTSSHMVWIPNAGLAITAAFKAELGGTATGNGMSVFVQGAIL